MLITLARKPLGGATVVQTCLAHGTGALNIDQCRIGTGTGAVTTVMVPDHRSGNFGQDTAAYKDRPKLAVQRIDQGRWPANVLVDKMAAAQMDYQGGDRPVSGGTKKGVSSKYDPTPSKGTSMFGASRTSHPITWPNDTGGASRYFKQINKDTP